MFAQLAVVAAAGIAVWSLALFLRARISARAARLAPPLLAMLAAALLWPLLLGRMPFSADHPVHLARAWHFGTEILARGRLSGWSDMWFAGWPAGEDYPPGADLWIAAFHALTFGALGWEGSYALAFLGMFALAGLAVYQLGRTHLSRAAGFIGALLFLLDRGAFWEGGWLFTVEWGVWPQALATAFACLAFAALDAVAREGRARDFALCALCVAAALLSHPITLVYFALAAPVWVAWRAFTTSEPAGRTAARALGALGLGAALAAFWLVPFAAKSAWMAHLGLLWKPLPAMARQLLQGALFGGVAPVVVWLGLFAGAAALRLRRFGAGFLILFALALILFGSSSTFHALLRDLSPAFERLQYQRLSVPAKIAFFLLAGHAVAATFGWLAAEGFSWKRWAAGAAIIAGASPLVEPVVAGWRRGYAVMTVREHEHHREFLDLMAYLKAESAREPEFHRVAFVPPLDDHTFAAAPFYSGVNAYVTGFSPASMFKNRPEIADPEMYRVLSVKRVVTVAPLVDPAMQPERRFGPFYVYRFTRYSPQRFSLEGPGVATADRFDPEYIRISLTGTTEASRLVLHVAHYPNWRAEQGGKEVPIATTDEGFFMLLPARDGHIDLRYAQTPADVAGSALSLLALAVLALLALPRVRTALSMLGARVERYGVAAGVTVVAAPVVLMVFAGAGDGATDLFHGMRDASVEMERNGAVTPCPRQGRARFECSAQDWNRVEPGFHRLAGEHRWCLWAHPAGGARLVIRLPGVKLGRALTGRHGILDDAVRGFPGEPPVEMEIALDGARLDSFVIPNRQGWREWRADTRAHAGRSAEVTFTVTSARETARHYCFTAQTEE